MIQSTFNGGIFYCLTGCRVGSKPALVVLERGFIGAA